METINKPSEQELKRWFSTGFLAKGAGTVNAEQHSLTDAAVIRCGEARGHQMWIDSEFCKQVQAAGNALGDKGLKARFGHPDMCSDALGTFLGRWKSLTAGSDGIVRGTLHLSATAAESPKGDLRNYVEQMAAKEPDHFGTSIVFSRDWEVENDFIVKNGGEYVFSVYDPDGTGRRGRTNKKSELPEGCSYWVDDSNFKSPDPSNTANLRHARLSALHAADLVDDPAATDSMFSGASGTALAARVSEWLDTHPEVLKAFSDEPEMVGIVERYATQLRPFMDRYSKNHLTTAEPAEVKPEAKPAEPEATLKARVEELEAQLQSSEQEVKRLTGELTGMSEELKAAQAALSALTSERDALVKERDALKADAETRKAELDAANKKLAALLSGAPPVSAIPDDETKAKGDFWANVRKTRKQ